MSLLFVNACVRPDSRTKELAEYLIERLCDDVTELNLEEENIQPLTFEMLERRNQLLQEGKFNDAMFYQAKQFASADTILIAAPYWDLSFPSSLKTLVEAISVVGVTFAYNDQGMPYGMCKAKRLIYVTTAGGPIISDDFGFGYIKALAETFYKIPEIYYFKAENLDVVGSDVKAILRQTKQEIDTIFS